jgi:hypothetical protein
LNLRSKLTRENAGQTKRRSQERLGDFRWRKSNDQAVLLAPVNLFSRFAIINAPTPASAAVDGSGTVTVTENEPLLSPNAPVDH